MRTLYHQPLDPFCRKIRLILGEKALEATLIPENPAERRHDFLAINPAGEIPVLLEDGTIAICGHGAITEYLDEMRPEPMLIGRHPRERAEARRLAAWFDEKFYREVTRNILDEKLVKRLSKTGQPDSSAIRAGLANIRTHLDYITYLMDRRSWLAGERFSIADIAAAAHLSCVDYCGDVPWENYSAVKDWYVRIKSRPSFRSILADSLPGAPPPRHYADLDF